MTNGTHPIGGVARYAIVGLVATVVSVGCGGSSSGSPDIATLQAQVQELKHCLQELDASAEGYNPSQASDPAAVGGSIGVDVNCRNWLRGRTGP